MSIWDLTDEDKKSMNAAGFSEKALDLYNDPEIIGELEDPSVCHTGESDHGERLRYCLKVEEGKIVKASYTYRGCPALSASAAATIRTAMYSSMAEAVSFTTEDVWRILGSLPPGHEEHVGFAFKTMKETLNIYVDQKSLVPADHVSYKHLCGMTGKELEELDVMICSNCSFVQNCENDHVVIQPVHRDLPVTEF